VGGFVAAEGHFALGPPLAFVVALGATDAESCVALRDLLGVGTLRTYERRKPHYDDVVTFQVRKLRDLVEVIVPFMDAHLPVSYKREQYDAWRSALLDYWEHRAKRVRPCTVEGCDEPGRTVCAATTCTRASVCSYRGASNS